MKREIEKLAYATRGNYPRGTPHRIFLHRVCHSLSRKSVFCGFMATGRPKEYRQRTVAELRRGKILPRRCLSLHEEANAAMTNRICRRC